MTARIDLFAPATITAYASGASSLGAAPPGGIYVDDPGSGTVTLSIVATDTSAAFSASGAGGATVSSNGNTLTITGLAFQVNAALATLEIFEPAGAVSDTIKLTAAEAGELPASTAIGVDVASTSGPSFVSPPTSLALAAWALDSIPGLVISDPALESLIAAGQGGQETLQLTLSAASGVLLLPNVSKISGITASGIGSNEVLLTFTGDQLAAVNALLAGLGFAGPAGTSGLDYGLRDLSGPLGPTVTSGSVTLAITGSAGAAQTIVTGDDTVILGLESIQAGTITVSAITTDLGGIEGGVALSTLPDARFDALYDTLDLGGTSFDDGSFWALALTELGTLVVEDAATVGQALYLGPAGVIDVSGTLVGGALAATLGQEGFSLAAGAILAGNGALVAGNFSNAAEIYGPGTVLAAAGGTLVIDAAGITGNAKLDVGGGAVLELGPVDPLYGVFDPTPLTIGAGTTIDFLAGNGPDAVTGAFGDNLDERGGVIVISSPGIFFGTIVNFAAGDRLIFPGLTGLTLLSITSQSFVVAGVDGNGNTDEYTINTAYAAGTGPFVYADNEGDGEVGLRPATNEILLGPTLAAAGLIYASPGVAQPVQGLNVLLRTWNTQSLQITISASEGMLSAPNVAAAAAIKLTAASPAALDAELEALTYTANGNAVADELQLTATNGFLIGISAAIPIDITAAGTVTGFGDAGQVALFAGSLGALIEASGTPGEMLVTGTAVFAGAIDAAGLAGTALRIDGGGIGVFDANADVTFDGGATIGDAGAGFLAVCTDEFALAGNLVVDQGGAALFGTVGVAGALQISGGDVDADGALTAALVSVGTAGTLIGGGGASLGAGALNDAGLVIVNDQAHVTVASAIVTGTLEIGGTGLLDVSGALLTAGSLVIGPDADVAAANLTQTAGGISLAGTLSVTSLLAAANISLAGGTMIASAMTLAGATLAGYGEIKAASGLAALALQGATILAAGLDIGADVQMSGASEILIAAGGSLQLDHAVTGGTVAFTAADAILTIDDVQQFAAGVGNFADHDVIDLIGVTPKNVTFSGGSVTAYDGQGQAINEFALSLAGGQPAVKLVSDGQGGTLITLGGDLPCFARGTRILTPSGYRPVEALAPGDQLVTAAGAVRPIRWIGRRTLDLQAAAPDQPVIFASGALAPGIPARPVRLSPLHAVYFGGVLVPALHLVNGATIRQQDAGAVTYFHIELDRHDIVLTEGMPVETYLENGNRGQLYEERGTRAGCRTPCAALVTAGPALAAIRRRLHRVALDAGYSLTRESGLRGVAAGAPLLPRITTSGRLHIASFVLPRNTADMALLARSAAPAETDPDSEDRRRLGICLAGCSPGARLASGWLPRGAGDQGDWMQSRAQLAVPAGLRTMTLALAAIVQSWRPPAGMRHL